MQNICVIGGGAAGIVASLKISENNHVILLEKNDKIGKKILVTGNGKCNLWNSNLLNDFNDITKYYNTDNYEVLNNIFKYKNDTYKYITEELGIVIKEKNNYIYPYSNSALSVRESFEKLLLNNDNIDVVCNFEVSKIEKEEETFKIYNSNNEYYTCDKVVVCCGSKSSNLGTESINKLFNNIKINDLYPSLVPIKLNEKYLSEWNGIRCDAKLSLFNDNNLIKEEYGEIQLTDYGISGIVSFNISGLINRLKGNKTIEIDFMPDYESTRLFDLIKNSKNKTIEELLETVFNYKLMFIVLKKANIDKKTLLNNLTENEIENLINTIKHFGVLVEGTLDFDRSQVTTGGISLNEVNDNLELKNIPGCYVIGEILDIDGICGGYNLASAFITGYLVGIKISN